jgi:hypothetical protein
MEYEESIGLVTGKMKKLLLIFTFKYFLWQKHDLSDNFFSVCHAPLPLPPFAKICLPPLASWAPEVFWANLMYLILRILKFDILWVPPIQIPTKKG